MLRAVLCSARLIWNKAKVLRRRARSGQKWPGSAAVNRLRRVTSRIVNPMCTRTISFLSGRVTGLLEKIHEAQDGAIVFA